MDSSAAKEYHPKNIKKSPKSGQITWSDPANFQKERQDRKKNAEQNKKKTVDTFTEFQKLAMKQAQEVIGVSAREKKENSVGYFLILCFVTEKSSGAKPRT